MRFKDKIYEEKIELSPHDWLFWSDEKFNNWRRENDFPRIVNFLFDSLPYFSLWLSEQRGLTEQDLLFHGPARFLRFYGEPVDYIEHDIGISFVQNKPAPKVIRYCFIKKSDKKNEDLKVLRRVEFSSYIDWAYLNRKWVFPNEINDLKDIVCFLTPNGRTSEDNTYLNSDSNIQFNIPLFMKSFSIDSMEFIQQIKHPPRLELLKLGGSNVEINSGLISGKNLEFVNVDNLTLISPVITSFQNFMYSTLRNFNVTGEIHAAKFHQCVVDLKVENGALLNCEFEYGVSKIELFRSIFYKSSINEKRYNLKQKDSDIVDCDFECTNIFPPTAKEKKSFHSSAKMTYSHLGYPDLAGKHYFLEKREERSDLFKELMNFKTRITLKRRVFYTFCFFWMVLQELYWGYGEKPFNIITSSLSMVTILALFGYLSEGSSTYQDLQNSFIFSFQSFTNISVKEITQEFDFINLIGSFMSFIGLMSVGLLVSSLSAKSKNYN